MFCAPSSTYVTFYSLYIVTHFEFSYTRQYNGVHWNSMTTIYRRQKLFDFNIQMCICRSNIFFSEKKNVDLCANRIDCNRLD